MRISMSAGSNLQDRQAPPRLEHHPPRLLASDIHHTGASPPTAITANPPSRPPLQRDQSVPLLGSSHRLRRIVERPLGAASAMPPTHSPPSDSSPHDHEAQNSRNAKRRKLESGRNTPKASPKVFGYGRYGQVEPGQLKMEISSCDAAPYRRTISNHPANMLNNEATFFCANSSRCNVTLQHRGGTIFNLTELTLRTPNNMDHSAP